MNPFFKLIMEIKDLQPRTGKVELVATVISKDEVRQIEKPNFSGRVCNASLKDDTGEIKMTLWNEQCDQVDVGDKIKISNGYVSEWQGEMQLSTGKFGQMEVLEKSKDISTDEGEHVLTEDEKTESELLSEEGEKTDEGEKILTEDEKEEAEIVGEKPDEEPKEAEDASEGSEEAPASAPVEEPKEEKQSNLKVEEEEI